MKYRNTKTGAVILTRCKLTGGNWQLLEPAAPAEIEDTAEDASEKAQPPKGDRPQTGAKPAAPAAKKPAARSAAGRKGK